jgi:hypothetical protein
MDFFIRNSSGGQRPGVGRDLDAEAESWEAEIE